MALIDLEMQQMLEKGAIHVVLRESYTKGMRVMVKIDLKNAYFTVPIWKKSPKVSEVCLEGNDVRVCLLAPLACKCSQSLLNL